MILEEIKEQLKKWSSTPPSEKPIFHCPICNQIYYTMEETMACLNRKAEPGPFKVGDIVMVSGKWVGYGNYPNDPWLACTRPAEPRAESHFDQVDQHWPWFVITSLWNEAHREVASLVTLLGGEIRSMGGIPPSSILTVQSGQRAKLKAGRTTSQATGKSTSRTWRSSHLRSV